MTDADLFRAKPTLRGAKVLLRPVSPADIQDIGAVLADPDVLRLTGSVSSTAETVGRSVDLDAATQKWYDSRAQQADRLDLAIVDPITGRCVGEAVLNELRERDDACNFRILIGPAGRDRGLGTEATRLMVDHAFRSTTLHRIELDGLRLQPARPAGLRTSWVPIRGREAAGVQIRRRIHRHHCDGHAPLRLGTAGPDVMGCKLF